MLAYFLYLTLVLKSYSYICIYLYIYVKDSLQHLLKISDNVEELTLTAVSSCSCIVSFVRALLSMKCSQLVLDIDDPLTISSAEIEKLVQVNYFFNVLDTINIQHIFSN